jgi:hypothetical protein
MSVATPTNIDLELLLDLNRRGGTASIYDGKPRQGADRLVDLGYATSRALNLSDIEYVITKAGRKALVLQRYGLPDRDYSIAPTKDPHGVPRVKFQSVGDPLRLVDLHGALNLTAELREIGDDDTASAIDISVRKARHRQIAGAD